MESRDSAAAERNSGSRRSRRRVHDSPRRHNPPVHTPPLDNRAPLHVTRARTFANPGNSHLQRHRLRRQREDDNFGTVQDAINRLNEVNSNLTSVLDEPLPQILDPEELAELREEMDSFNRSWTRILWMRPLALAMAIMVQWRLDASKWLLPAVMVVH